MIPDPRANRWWRGVAVLTVLAVAILACTRGSDSVPAGPRIVSIGGSVTEIAFALGAGDDIIAVDTSSVYPETARALPKVGYQRTLAAEGILSLKPTLILAADEAGPPTTLDQLKFAGVPVARMPNASIPSTTLARSTGPAARHDTGPPIRESHGPYADGRTTASVEPGELGRPRGRCARHRRPLTSDENLKELST